MSPLGSDAIGECLWCGAEISETRFGDWVAHPSQGLDECSEATDGNHEPITHSIL